MAFEFLQAFAKFFVDKSQFDKSLKGVVDDTEKAGKKVEDVFAKGFKRGLHQSGEALDEIGQKVGKFVGIITSPWALAAAGAVLLADQLIETGKAALEFDREYTKVRVLLDGTPAELRAVKQDLLGVSTELATGAEFAGVYRRALLDLGNTDAARQVALVAVQLAKVSEASPTETVRLLGSILDSTGQKADQAANIAGKLFDLMKKGGGEISELSGSFLNLLDTAGSMGIRLEEVNGILIRLGEVAGASPQKNMIALNLAIAALSANSQKLREQGLDLDNAIKAEGAIGALKLLDAATGGSRERLRELGIAGRNATSVIKLLADVAKDGGQALSAAISGNTDAGATDIATTLAKRRETISTHLHEVDLMIKRAREQAGTGILDSIFGKGDPEKPVKELERITAEVERLEATLLQSARRNAEPSPLQRLQLQALLDRKAVLQATLDVEENRARAAKDAEAALTDEERATRDNAAAHAEAAVTTADAMRIAGDATAAYTKFVEGLRQKTIQLAMEQKQAVAETKRLADALEIPLEKFESMGIAGRQQGQALLDARERMNAEARVRGEETLQAEVTRNLQRLQSTLSTDLAIAESERSLAQARAQVDGQVAGGLEELLALRKRVAEEGARAQLKADDEITASAVRAAQHRIDAMREQADELAQRPGFADSLDMRKQFEGLHDQIAKATAELDKLQKDAAVKRVTTEQKLQQELAKMRTDEFNARRAQIIEEQKLDDQRFAHRLAMGQVTIQEEIDRPRLLGMDPDRTAEERAKFAEQARSREKQAQQEMLDFLQAINRLTLQDAIATQQAITDATKRGTQERMDAERRLADMIKSFRQAAAAAAGSLFDLAASRVEKERNAALQAQIDQIRAPQETARRAALSPDERRIEDLEKEKQKPVMLSPEQVQQEFAKARAEAMAAAATFAQGGAITPDQFKSMGSIAGINDQLSVFGGGLAGASVALEQFAQNLLKPFDQELKDRGIGQGGPSMLTPSASDSPEVADIKARARADNAMTIAGPEQLGGPVPDIMDQMSLEGLMRAREAMQRAYPTPASRPDVSGAAERANAAEAGMGTAADAARRADEAAKQFQSGAMDGLKDAGASVDGTAVGRQIAVAIYRAVYDKLAVDIEREAARMV